MMFDFDRTALETCLLALSKREDECEFLGIPHPVVTETKRRVQLALTQLAASEIMDRCPHKRANCQGPTGACRCGPCQQAEYQSRPSFLRRQA